MKLRTGDRVRVPDGREGELCWIIPSGKEAAVALDGVYGTFHIHPTKLVRIGAADSGQVGKPAREETILHRPATELVPESVLAGMEQNGWTPTQARELIASYRELARDVQELREQKPKARRA